MNDKDFLQWIHGRLKNVHGENENIDYMLKLQSIINGMNDDVFTPNTAETMQVRVARPTP